MHAPARLPSHMHLDSSQHVMRNVSCFRLRAHKLKVKTAAWDTQDALLCDRYSYDEVQDEAHALLVCRGAHVCALRRKYVHLFKCFSGDFSMEQPFTQQASVQDVLVSSCNTTTCRTSFLCLFLSLWTLSSLPIQWMALPLRPLSVHGAPFSVPRYLHLELGKHMLRNKARFCLHAHTLRVETSLWQEHTSASSCDRCDQEGLQDEKHAVFHCSCDPALSSILKLALRMFLLEQLSRPSSQTTWLKIKPHCNHCNHYGHDVDWRGPVTGRSAEQSGRSSPHRMLSASKIPIQDFPCQKDHVKHHWKPGALVALLHNFCH
eukprot:1140746-Pelagomonas_calceolata.AAC.2